ncbi:hypothetical protein ACC808_00690 [Rhizobium ruizarguesonis]|jgi:hypothetical protein|uniref:DUF7338 family protein n=1 Tax=Rhizobium ruizarguesonis TaxID=2081791 RepID=UPI001CF4CFFD|nr:hypothetical protein [Rhizobium ruizarguesonis]MCB2403985.1 hypothetical protein [Rhizobium ruizarguesonis]
MLVHNWREVLKRARSVRLTMFALLYIIYLPVNITFVLLAYPLSPFLAAWSMKHGPVLPGRWRWFSTLNADLDGYTPQRVAGFDPAAKGFKLWWQRTRWTWRNPYNGWHPKR